MKKQQNTVSDAMQVLMETSRTFYIPISRLSDGLKEAVASAYLCMRAIDQIEDHERLPADAKIHLLRNISEALAGPSLEERLETLFAPYREALPEVTLRLAEWVKLSPEAVVARVLESTAAMASGMADWVDKQWIIRTKDDLDNYTYCVAGAVGELLSDLWFWNDGTETDRDEAIAFGRGLQAVNIVRNYKEDDTRGVNFFPDGWGLPEMLDYARDNLRQADRYVASMKPGPGLDFCRIPLALAHATLKAVASGKEKLARKDVLKIVGLALKQKKWK